MKKIINIFGDITSQPKSKNDVSAEIVSTELSSLNKGDELEININSYGGEVFEAVAISNIIASSQASREFNILGICASAATMLFSATDIVNISKGAMVMYHKPIVNVSGNAFDLRKTAKLLDKMEKETILRNLEARTGKISEELITLLTDEWWLTSDEAIQILGFKDAGINAIENKAETRQIGIYQNYIARKKALSNNAYQIFINHKNSLK
jgi:ATP-dependent Clp protease, protease subunit